MKIDKTIIERLKRISDEYEKVVTSALNDVASELAFLFDEPFKTFITYLGYQIEKRGKTLQRELILIASDNRQLKINGKSYSHPKLYLEKDERYTKTPFFSIYVVTENLGQKVLSREEVLANPDFVIWILTSIKEFISEISSQINKLMKQMELAITIAKEIESVKKEVAEFKRNVMSRIEALAKIMEEIENQGLGSS